MAERIVDVLEIVDVGQQQRAAGESLVVPEQILDRMLQAAAVLQPRQGIQQRLVLSLLQAFGQDADFARAGLQFARQLEGDRAHLLRILDEIAHDLTQRRAIEIGGELRHMVLQ